MSVTEIASATGEWSLTLKPNTPKYVLDKLDYFGHICVMPGRIDPTMFGDDLMDSARYVGVNRGRSFGEDNKSISGPGMAFWLGDEDDKGYTLEDLETFTNTTFTATLTDLLPPSLQVGTINALPGLFNGSFQYLSRRKAIDFVTSLYNAEWRITGKGKFDAGTIPQLYVTDPKCAVIRNREGLEMTYRALPGEAKLDSDVKDFTTRVILLASSADNTSTVSADADIAPELNPYVDLFGNPIVLTRVISETATDEGNAPARAQLQLNRFTSPRDSLKLTSEYYDIKGDVSVGDYIWVYDDEALLTNPANELDWHGERIWPIKLRLFQMTWPITSKMGVVFRTNEGEWIDLSDWFEPETGTTDLVVGGYNRSLTGSGSTIGDNPSNGPILDDTTPDVVELTTPFLQSTYQSDVDGLTRAQVEVVWDQPLNTDGTVIADGLEYEIRFRTGQTGVYDLLHSDLSFYTHSQLLGTFGSPIPYNLGPWTYTQVSWDFNEALLTDLTPGIPYDIQIRAKDQSVPPHVGEWSDLYTFQTRPDTRAPSDPAPCQTVAGSRNAIQVVHTLGQAEGGEYNLESDINHLRVHIGMTADFFPVSQPISEGGTMAGKIPVNIGMMRGQIPAVATFQLDDDPDTPRWIKVTAVDNYGNESGPSTAVQQTAVLIDSAFISELTVSRVSAGTIGVDWLMAGEISTALFGARVNMGWYGIEGWNLQNVRTFFLDSSTGNVTIIGKFIASDPANPGDVIIMWPSFNNSYPTITFESSGAAHPGPAYINAIPGFGGPGTALGLNSGPSIERNFGVVETEQSTLILGGQALRLQYNTLDPVPNIRTGGWMYGDNVELAFGLYAANHADPALLGWFTMRQLETFWSYRDGTGAEQGYMKMNTDIVTMGRLGGENSGNGTNGVELYNNGVRFYANGVYGFEYRYSGTDGNHIVSTDRYTSFGENEARMQVDGPAGDTFSMRNGGGADPIMDMDGYSARFVKNFVIDNPMDSDKWLVHACTESPVAGVEYTGTAVIQDYRAVVELPAYFEDLCELEGRTVQVTPMLPPDGAMYPFIPRAIGSVPRSGRFFISSDGLDGTLIAWRVFATRKDAKFPVEPLKTEYERAGDGPYTYLEAK